MKGLSIALRIIAILGAIAAVVAWVMTKGKVEEAETKIAQLETRAGNLTTQVDELDSQLTAARGEKNQISEQLADSRARINALQKENLERQRAESKLRTETRELEQKYAELESANDQLKREILDVQTNRPQEAAVDPAKLQELEDQLAAVREELENTKDKLSAANLRAQAASGGAPSGGTGASGGQADGAAPTIAQLNAQSASILRSDPEKGILIISRGQVDGLQRQMEFNVAKGLEKTVRVKVGTVAPTYAVAYVLPGQDPSHLQEGDQISINK